MSKRLIYLPLLFALLASSCRQDAEKLWTVSYRIIQTNNSPAAYSVSYTAENSVTRTEGPISDAWWSSEEVNGISSGEFVSLSMNIKTGGGNYDMQILRDGAVHADSTLSSPVGTVTISVVI